MGVYYTSSNYILVQSQQIKIQSNKRAKLVECIIVQSIKKKKLNNWGFLEEPHQSIITKRLKDGATYILRIHTGQKIVSLRNLGSSNIKLVLLVKQSFTYFFYSFNINQIDKLIKNKG